MRLRAKLLLLVGVPIVGALLLAYLVIVEARQGAQRAAALGSVEKVAHVGRRAVVLLVSLQRERRSALIPVGLRSQVLAGRELADRVAIADVSLREFRESVGGLDRKRLPAGVAEALDRTLKSLMTLNELRSKSGADVYRTIEGLLGGYADIVEALTGFVSTLRAMSADHEIAGDVTTVVALLRVHEQESRLSGLLGFVLAKGDFPPGSFRLLVNIAAEARVHDATVRADAGEDTRIFFEGPLLSEAGKVADKVINEALNSVDAPPQVSADVWHEAHNRKLTIFRALERQLLDRIEARASAKSAYGRQKVLEASLLTGVVVLGSCLLAWVIARGLHRSLGALHSVALRVSETNDYSARAARLSNDEVGQLADVWNETLAHVQLRDNELSAHRKNLEATVASRTEELLSERLRLELILVSAGEGIVGLDDAARVTFMNPAAETLLGIGVAEAAGREFHKIVQHESGKGACTLASCPILQTMNTGIRGALGGQSLKRGDGSSLAVEGSVTGILLEGRVKGAVLTIQDVTERKQLESQLQQARKLEAIGNLAAGIAHEINTPMQFIGDNVSFLRGAVDDLLALVAGYRAAVGDSAISAELKEQLLQMESDKDLEYVSENAPKSCDSAREGVERVRKIVYAMKDFSHPGGNEKQSGNLNRAIESTVIVATNVWKGVADLDLVFDTALPPVPVLLGEINQVILNLVVNAAHAIGDRVKDGQKGRIRISTSYDETHVEVRVADTGGGIPEAIRERIFDPFFTTKEVGKGTGQGLALARSVIVDRHGGTLTFESVTGEGTTFIVRLPREQTGLDVKVS